MADPRIIEAEQIVLRDAAGNARICLDALSAAGPSVQVLGDNGKLAAEIRAFPGDHGVALMLRGPRRYVVVRLEQERSFITLSDGEGKHSIEIAAPLEAGGGRLEVFRNGEVVASVPTEPNQPVPPRRGG